MSSGNDDLDTWFGNAYSITSVLEESGSPKSKKKLGMITPDLKLALVGKNIFSLSPSCTMKDVLGTLLVQLGNFEYTM